MYELVQFESSNFVFCVTATAVLEKDYLSIFRSRDRRYRHTDRHTDRDRHAQQHTTDRVQSSHRSVLLGS